MPVEKIPAAVCLRFSATRQTRATARARSAGVAAAVAAKEARRLFEYFCLPSIGSRSGFFGWHARQIRRGSNRAPQRFFVRLVRGGARGAAVDDRAHGNAQLLLGDVLMDGVVGEARERVGDHVDIPLRSRPPR